MNTKNQNTKSQLAESKAFTPFRGPWGSHNALTNSAKKEVYKQLKAQAHRMRLFPTAAEKLLWEHLKNNSLGFKFRRQHIVDQYIVDFFCFEKNLVIELDGEVHDKQQEQDKVRQEALESLGYTVIRFKNEDLFNDLEQVLETIKKSLLIKKPPNLLKEEQAKE